MRTAKCDVVCVWELEDESFGMFVVERFFVIEGVVKLSV